MVCASIVAALLMAVAIFTVLNACRVELQGLNVAQAAAPGKKSTKNHESWYCIEGIDLSEDDRYSFLRVWCSVLERSKSNPQAAVQCADYLLSDLMEECGCRISGPARGAATHLREEIAHIKNEIQTAHEIAVHSSQGRVNPGEVKRAMQLYTELFDKLVG